MVVGMARAKQDEWRRAGSGPELAAGSGDPFPVLPILLHGDAAFAGQGVVAETLNLSQLAGYRTGGTIHIVINNQLGFTTAPEAARTSVYPTDVAKMVQAPIFHVNGDDPEACARAARLAFGFRQAFHKDVVIDMVCYRRHGHNEGDDPSYTQPLMYALIEAKRSVRKLYTESLVRRGDISIEEAEQALDDFSARLQAALDETRAEAEAAGEPEADAARLRRPRPAHPGRSRPAWTSAVLTRLARWCARSPTGFVMHPKLARQFEQRDKMVADGEIDWALGEALAFGIASRGGDQRPGDRPGHPEGDVLPAPRRAGRPRHRCRVRASGRAGPGAGSLHHPRLAPLRVRLSRLRVRLLGRGASTIWWPGRPSSATSGTAAEIIVDNFLVAAEDKWGQNSGLVMLLPHGYEGQGPEHSSARIERFLDHVRPGEPAGHRSDDRGPVLPPPPIAQVRRDPSRPLIVFTPKSLLRPRQARSPIAAFVAGSFAEVLDDPRSRRRRLRAERRAPGRPVLGQGGLRRHWPGATAWVRPAAGVVVVRVEQLYPWPQVDHRSASSSRYPNAAGGGVAAGGAREHGRLELRAQPAAPPGARHPHAPAREPGRVGQPGHGQRRLAPARAGRPAHPSHRLRARDRAGCKPVQFR